MEDICSATNVEMWEQSGEGDAKAFILLLERLKGNYANMER